MESKEGFALFIPNLVLSKQMEDLKWFTEGHLRFVNNEQIESLARFLSDNIFSKDIFLKLPKTLIQSGCEKKWAKAFC